MKKTKILLSALITVAMCVSLISGATFALFTSQSNVDITVTSGKVKIGTNVELSGAWSAVYDDAAGEYGKTGEVAGSDALIPTEGVYTFSMGGSAAYDQTTQTLQLTGIAAGDGATLRVGIVNYSTVAVKYRVLVSTVEDDGLFAGLAVSYLQDGAEVEFHNKINRYTDWIDLDAAADADSGEAVSSLDISIELPVGADNAFADKSATIQLTVSAVQRNGSMEDPTDPIVLEPEADGKVDQAGVTERFAELKDGDEVRFDGDYVYDGKVVDYPHINADCTVDLGGHNIEFQSQSMYVGSQSGSFGIKDPRPVDVTFENGTFTTYSSSGALRIENASHITFRNIEFITTAKGKYSNHGTLLSTFANVADADPSEKLSLSFEHCKFINGSVDVGTGSGSKINNFELIFKDCDFIADSTRSDYNRKIDSFIKSNLNAGQKLSVTISDSRITYNTWGTTDTAGLFGNKDFMFMLRDGDDFVLENVTITGQSWEFSSTPLKLCNTANSVNFTCTGTNTYTYNGEAVIWKDYLGGQAA